MTKFTKLSLVVAFSLTTIFTYANNGIGDYTLNIITGNGKVVSFTLNTIEKSIFSIYDLNNNLLYTGDFATNELEVAKTISLESFQPGTYLLEVKSNDKVSKHKITVKGDNKTTVKLDQSVNKSPAFRR